MWDYGFEPHTWHFQYYLNLFSYREAFASWHCSHCCHHHDHQLPVYLSHVFEGMDKETLGSGECVPMLCNQRPLDAYKKHLSLSRLHEINLDFIASCSKYLIRLIKVMSAVQMVKQLYKLLIYTSSYFSTPAHKHLDVGHILPKKLPLVFLFKAHLCSGILQSQI